MSDLYEDDDAVPASQKRDMMKHLEKEERKAAQQLRDAQGKDYDERKRREYDLAGVQALKRGVSNWRTK